MNWKVIIPVGLIIVLAIAVLATQRTDAPSLTQQNGIRPQSVAATGDPDQAAAAIVADAVAENNVLAQDANSEVVAVANVQNSLSDLGTSFSANDY